jgi:hypothetical protein
MFRKSSCPSSGAYKLQVAASGLPFERGDSFVVGCGPPPPPPLLAPRATGNPEAATAVCKLLMMGTRMPETCWAIYKRRAINLRDWCIWLVDLFECMMMHGVTDPKFRDILAMHGHMKVKKDYRRSRGSCCLHNGGRWRQQYHLKWFYPSIKLKSTHARKQKSS